MKIELVNIDDLDLDPKNARKHDAKNLKAIADSLDLFGQRKPIVVWGRTVVAGNGTMAAARSLGWTEITVARVPDDWSADQVKAYALADNRSAELAVWDEQVLASQLLELQEAEFDIELLGFELPVDELSEVVEDEIPEQVELKSKLGDVWKLGRHRLLCGDSSSITNLDALLQGEKIELVFTDPPYRYKTMGAGGAFDKGFADLKKDIAALVDFDPTDFLNVLPTVFADNMNAYIFCNTDLVPDYCLWAKQNKYNFNILTWHKKSFIPATNGHHFPDTEYLIYISKNAVWNNGQDVNYGKYFVMDNEKSADHPTIKPQEIITTELLISSSRKGNVLDLFGGSGSTLIACEQTDRTCFMMELDPKYVDVIIARWEKLTGETAELIEG
jgi:site-specific DNA-methyltransferase (adenine-specific)